MQDEMRERLLDTYMQAVRDNKELRKALGGRRSVHSVNASKTLVDAKRLLGRMGVKIFEGRPFIFFVADIETLDGAGADIDVELPVFVAFPPQPGQEHAWDRCHLSLHETRKGLRKFDSFT